MKKYIDIALNEIAKGNFTKAIEISNKIIAEEPANPEGFELRGDCYYHMKNFEQAQINYNDAAELAKSRDRKYTSQLYNKKGISNLKQKNYKAAAEDFRKSVKYNPENFKAYNNKSKALRLSGELEDAILDATRAVILKPDLAEAYNNRGSAYFNLSKTDECIDDFTKAIKIKPSYAVAYFNRGAAYFYLKKDYLGAKLDWEKAISLKPSYETEVREKIKAINEAYEKLALEKKSEPSYEKKPEPEKDKFIPPPVTRTADTESEKNISIKDADYLSEGIESLRPKEESSILEFDRNVIKDEIIPAGPPEEKKPPDYIDEFLKEYETTGSFSDSFIEVEKKEIKEGKITPDSGEKFPDLEEFIKEKEEKTADTLPEVKMSDELKKLHEEIVSFPPPPAEKTEDKEPIIRETVQETTQKIPASKYISPVQKQKKTTNYLWLYIVIIVLIIAVIIMALISSGVFDEKETQETAAMQDTPKISVFISEKQSSDTASAVLEKSFEEMLVLKGLILIENDTGYSLQAGSFKDSLLAVKRVEQLSEQNLKPYIYRFDKDSSQILYRVRLGNFKTLSEADSVASQIK
ncbi:MAG: tetratricopeptide repeat protein [Ignavibacteria bacterium]|nr:tetratricopeptide repeat protein [Ignavibacteria bacterium]